MSKKRVRTIEIGMGYGSKHVDILIQRRLGFYDFTQNYYPNVTKKSFWRLMEIFADDANNVIKLYEEEIDYKEIIVKYRLGGLNG